MAKRPNPRAIKAARTYTVEEAADTLGVSIGTVRTWVKSGLPLMIAQRPFLILGESLRDFLLSRAKAAKVPLEPDHLFCLSCKVGRKPLGGMVDCIPQTAKTARLFGLCEVCGSSCNRMISNTRINHYNQIFEVAIKEGRLA